MSEINTHVDNMRNIIEIDGDVFEHRVTITSQLIKLPTPALQTNTKVPDTHAHTNKVLEGLLKNNRFYPDGTVLTSMPPQTGGSYAVPVETIRKAMSDE